MSTLDNLYAFKILYMLVTPFEKTEAFKLGVIDKDGNVLVKSKDRSYEQKNAYDALDRIVFSLKRLLAKIPGGSSQIASVAAAYYLVKEHLVHGSSSEEINEEIFDKIINEDIILVEEQLVVEEFLALYEEMGAGVVGGGSPNPIANVTGAKVATDQPVINPKKRRPHFGNTQVPDHVFRRLNKKLFVGVK